MAETLATLSHGVIQKEENMTNEVADLAKISYQSVECATWFILLLIVKLAK